MNISETEGNINDFFFTISMFFSMFFITYSVAILKEENTVKSLKSDPVVKMNDSETEGNNDFFFTI